MLCSFPSAAMTKHHTFRGIKPHKFIVLQFYRVEIRQVPADNPFSWLIRVVGRIRFLAVLRLRPPSVAAVSWGPHPASRGRLPPPSKPLTPGEVPLTSSLLPLFLLKLTLCPSSSSCLKGSCAYPGPTWAISPVQGW